MLRKHVKLEPEIFYYYCDLHGMLVMQDMINNGTYSFLWDTAIPALLPNMAHDDKNQHTDPETREMLRISYLDEAGIPSHVRWGDETEKSFREGNFDC